MHSIAQWCGETSGLPALTAGDVRSVVSSPRSLTHSLPCRQHVRSGQRRGGERAKCRTRRRTNLRHADTPIPRQQGRTTKGEHREITRRREGSNNGTARVVAHLTLCCSAFISQILKIRQFDDHITNANAVWSVAFERMVDDVARHSHLLFVRSPGLLVAFCSRTPGPSRASSLAGCAANGRMDRSTCSDYALC
jgi:hypothetical protein